MWFYTEKGKSIGAIDFTQENTLNKNIFSFFWNLTYSGWYTYWNMFIKFKNILYNNCKRLIGLDTSLSTPKKISPCTIYNKNAPQSIFGGRIIANVIHRVIVFRSDQVETVYNDLSWEWLAANDVNLKPQLSDLHTVLCLSMPPVRTVQNNFVDHGLSIEHLGKIAAQQLFNNILCRKIK